ncbi:hypothetical protein L207DRAFT_509484 [Hyaloscypha variabilis F]|uniref:Uncharacterized protein n=1 Tax=Hyaloscypha variabilis (strain UAMH 11265 / GT02V1 / F) TaxID=1149755 RepID=A0A2J6RWI9_HYAVF|nr:hypothetical protein L207DRAFT_509484 [Hyaloscypha variabilis F]
MTCSFIGRLAEGSPPPCADHETAGCFGLHRQILPLSMKSSSHKRNISRVKLAF